MKTEEAITHTKEDASKGIYDHACDVIIGGVSRNTVYRKPHPYYAESAKGCYVKDIEGTERIDFANNMASLIHGHVHPKITEAVIEQIQRGSAYTLATEAEVRLADHLTKRVESIQKVRFVNSGTEAVMTMIKAARAYTGKPMIAKAEGAYHGTYDFAEVSQVTSPSKWGSLKHPNSVPLVKGTPKEVTDLVAIFPFNDIKKTLDILDSHKDKIACVLIDPVPHRVGLTKATNEYIEAIYKWTRENNALLCFDEVVTLRVHYGGAQDDYSVKPDLMSMGKMIGGGYPVGALAGRTDVMDVLNPQKTRLRFPHSGTFSANPVSMTAGYMAMEMFDQEAVYALNALTMRARKQIEEAGRIADIPLSLTGAGSMFRVHFRENPPLSFREAYQNEEERAIIKAVLDHLFFESNIMMINTCACMFSTVMTGKEVDRLSEGMLNAFKAIKPKLIEANLIK